MDFLNSLLPTIEHFRILGYWIVLLVSLLESLAFVGIAIPGTIFIILVGFISAKGFLDLGDLILFTAAGAILGDMISYYLGSHAEKFFSSDSKIFQSKYLEKGKSFFNTYGGGSIFLGRFIGPIRPIIPFVAGMFRMNRKRFILWNIFSGFAWASTFLLLGFFFGQAWETVALWSTRGSVLILTLAIFVFIIYILKRFTVRKGKQIFYFLSSVLHSIQKAIVSNSEVQKLVEKHFVFFKFIKGRFNKNKFLGLPLTLLSFSFIYTLILFIGIIEDVITSDIIISIDTRISNLLTIFRNSDLTQFFLWITVLGKWQIILGFTVTTICILWIWHKRLYIAPLLLTIIGTEIFTAISKIAFHRPRPELALYTEPSFSFPSGHAAIAIAFYGFLAYILIRHFAKWKTKVNIFFIGLSIILLIGFSRLYLGVHYVSDVWGGYLVGALWLIIGISISEWILSFKNKSTIFAPNIKTYIVSTILVVSSLGLYTIFAASYNPQILQQHVPQKEIVQNVSNIFTDTQLKYTETLSGGRQEPISFIILADNDTAFVKAFINSGWYLADNVTISSLTKTVLDTIFRREYLNAPMTPSFWDKQTHNFGFEKPTETNNVRQRHHARFWRTNYVTSDGKGVYVGTASLDTGIKFMVTHKIAPSIDTEREFLFTDLQNSTMIQSFQKDQSVKPVLGENFTGDQFFTDGKMYIVYLK